MKKNSLTTLVLVICCCFSELVHCEELLHLNKIALPDRAVTLYLYIKPIDSGLAIEAEFKSQKTSFKVGNFPAEKLKAFLDLNSKPSDRNYSKVAPILKEYGRTFFRPIKKFLRQCTEIEFVIGNDSLISYPFDFLIFEGKPLFLQKPIAYSFKRIGPRRFNLKDVSGALLISDKTADPQRAVIKVQKYIPNNRYRDIAEIKPTDFKAMDFIDLLLMSAHGHIFADEDDYIEFGDDRLKTNHLANLRPRMVYLDSCFMGSSLDFIKLFRSNEAAFYIAPIVPNEAGNSSTKTMTLFFEAFDIYGCPVYAMYLTRCQLYEHFSKQGMNFMLFFRSFPFRVYRLEGKHLPVG
ncbi:MAG: hypothetical protein PVH77_01985 [Phycisphaerales bacterium]